MLFRKPTKQAEPDYTRATATSNEQMLATMRRAYNLGDGRALSVPGVWASVNLIANTLSAMPLAATDAANNAVTLPLLRQPDPNQLRVVTIYQLVYSLALHGNAVALIDRDEDGTPRSIIPVHPSAIGVKLDPVTGQRRYTLAGFDRELSPADVMHVPYLMVPGELKGYGPIEAHRELITSAIELNSYTRNAFSTMSVPPGYIKLKDRIPKTELDKIAMQWQAAYSGGNHSTAVVDNDAEYITLAFDPEKLQLLGTRKLLTSEIAQIFSVPPYLIGAEASAAGGYTYSNSETEGIRLLRYALRPYMIRLEEAFSALVGGGYEVRFDPDDLLRGTTKERYDAYKEGLAGGWLTLDEVRESERLPALEQQPAADNQGDTAQ